MLEKSSDPRRKTEQELVRRRWLGFMEVLEAQKSWESTKYRLVPVLCACVELKATRTPAEMSFLPTSAASNGSRILSLNFGHLILSGEIQKPRPSLGFRETAEQENWQWTSDLELKLSND